MSGGSKSSASTSTSTTTVSTDARQVLDGGSIGVSGSSGTSITVLDAGAVQGALEIAAAVVEGAGNVIDRGVDVQEAQGALLAAAYTDSKGTKDVLVIGSLLVGAVAIAFMLKK